MKVKKAFAAAVLGTGLVAAAGAGFWWKNNPDTVALLKEAKEQYLTDARYKSVIKKNMTTPERHALYEQVERSMQQRDDGAICFIIPPGTSDADATAVSNIVRAQEALSPHSNFVITRGAPAPGCKPAF